MGRGSSFQRACLMTTRPLRVSACPLRAFRVGRTQSNMSMPAPIATEQVARGADAHEIAGPLGVEPMRHLAQGLVHALDRLAHREAAERQPVERAARRAPPRARSAGRRSMPPWTMPKSACAGGRGAAKRAARPPGGPGDGGLDDGDAESRRAGTRRAASGCRRRGALARARLPRGRARGSDPSRCDLNVNPSSVPPPATGLRWRRRRARRPGSRPSR